MKNRLSLFALALVLAPACSGSDDDTGSNDDNQMTGGTGGGGGSGGDAAGSGGDAPSGGDGSGGSAGGAACELVALTCPDGCDSLEGMILDSQRACISRNVRIGCWPPDEPITEDLSCIKQTSNGDLFQLPSGTYAAALAETSDYEACSDAESAAALAALQCVNTGTDPDSCPVEETGACPTGCDPYSGRIYDGDAMCLQPEAQIGCISQEATLTKNGGCVEEVATGDVWLLSSGSYAQKMLISGLYIACGLDDVAGASGDPPDCQ